MDIAAQLATHGERLPGSIPLPAAAGDVAIHNRNLVHCSFTNHSADLRVTVYFGFHARSTVEGNCESEHIRRRARIVDLALAARAADPRFADRGQYVYRPWIRAAGNAITAPSGTVLRTPYLAQ